MLVKPNINTVIRCESFLIIETEGVYKIAKAVGQSFTTLYYYETEILKGENAHRSGWTRVTNVIAYGDEEDVNSLCSELNSLQKKFNALKSKHKKEIAEKIAEKIKQCTMDD